MTVTAASVDEGAAAGGQLRRQRRPPGPAGHPGPQRHASRRGRGSMGGYAPAGPHPEPDDDHATGAEEHRGGPAPAAAASSGRWPGEAAAAAATARAPAAGQTHEESGEHHEAVQPHQARLHDQHGRQQACR